MFCRRGMMICMLFLIAHIFIIPNSTTGIYMNFNVDQLDSCINFTGEKEDYSGWCVSSAGDVNGDGFDDMLIGAYRGIHEEEKVGKTYLIFGGMKSEDINTNLSEADVTFIGEDVYDYSGHSVSSAGDVNGDGFYDILIGAYSNDEGGFHSGRFISYSGNLMVGKRRLISRMLMHHLLVRKRMTTLENRYQAQETSMVTDWMILLLAHQ